MASQFLLLKTKRFLPLFVTQFLGALNDNVFKNALGLMMIYHAAHALSMDARVLTTASAGIFILPFFLFSALAGQMADKFEKSRMIRIIKLVEISLMLVAAVGFWYAQYELLLFVLFCVGTHSAFFGPLKYSILPAHLKADELIGGNALIEAGTFLAILLGTVLSGVLILQQDGAAGVAAAIVALSCLGWFASRSIPLTPAVVPALKINPNFIQETWRITHYVAQDKNVFVPILGISWFWLVGFVFLSQFPIYAKDILGADEGVVTLFLTVFSVGIAIGSLICNKLLKGKVSGAYVPLGAMGMTAAIFCFWALSPAPVAAAETLIGVEAFLVDAHHGGIVLGLLAVAVFGGIYIVPLYALMQARSQGNYLSRTIAVNNIVNSLFMVLGTVLLMILLKMHMNVSDILLTIGILNIPVALLLRRWVRSGA